MANKWARYLCLVNDDCNVFNWTTAQGLQAAFEIVVPDVLDSNEMNSVNLNSALKGKRTTECFKIFSCAAGIPVIIFACCSNASRPGPLNSEMTCLCSSSVTADCEAGASMVMKTSAANVVDRVLNPTSFSPRKTARSSGSFKSLTIITKL